MNDISGRHSSVVNVSAMDQSARAIFYASNAATHFWFSRVGCGFPITYHTSCHESGHLWWRKKVYSAVPEYPIGFVAGKGSYQNNIMRLFSDYIKTRCISGYTITLMAYPEIIKVFSGENAMRYFRNNYNVCWIRDDKKDRMLTMEETIEFCKQNLFRDPDFEIGDFVLKSLSEIFNTFSSFDKYLYECDKMGYELVLFRAAEES